jgi:NAD(P)-dependent dehydrogenase (short-subunit alcohol dehydrogenase family)
MGVLVAGGTGALGTAVVRELVGSGRSVVATWTVREERERLAELPVELVEADLLDAGAAERAVAAVEELDAVADLVGGFRGGPRVHETNPEDFEGIVRLNLKPAFTLARASMPRMMERGGGAFVAVSARPALRPFAGAAGYITGKAAVLAFVQALDAEYRNHGIRCNAILPSVIDTPENRESQPDADWSRWVSPEEIAKVVRFLVSDESRPTSGAGIPVYGRA